MTIYEEISNNHCTIMLFLHRRSFLLDINSKFWLRKTFYKYNVRDNLQMLYIIINSDDDEWMVCEIFCFIRCIIVRKSLTAQNDATIKVAESKYNFETLCQLLTFLTLIVRKGMNRPQ